MRRVTQLAAAIALLASAAACGGSSSPSTVVAPTGTVVTETFTGTVNPPVAGVAQHDMHTFTVTVAGGINIVLVSAGPPATITMGLGIGTPSTTGTCSYLSGGTTTGPAASAQTQLTGTLAAGTYCVDVVDVGNVLQPITYTVTVAHT